MVMSRAIVRDEGVLVSPPSAFSARRRRVASFGDDAQAAAEPLALELPRKRRAVPFGAGASGHNCPKDFA